MKTEKTMDLRIPSVSDGGVVGLQNRVGRVHSDLLLGVLIAGWSTGWFILGVATTLVALDLLI